jgi:hypothetical protein
MQRKAAGEASRSVLIAQPPRAAAHGGLQWSVRSVVCRYGVSYQAQLLVCSSTQGAVVSGFCNARLQHAQDSNQPVSDGEVCSITCHAAVHLQLRTWLLQRGGWHWDLRALGLSWSAFGLGVLRSAHLC